MYKRNEETASTLEVGSQWYMSESNQTSNISNHDLEYNISDNCLKAVCVRALPSAGLGHRVMNLLQGKLMSLALRIPLATTNLEVGIRTKYRNENYTEKYNGLNDLFPISRHIVHCPQQQHLAGWYVKRITLNLKQLSIFEMNSTQIEKLRVHVNESKCNTVFIVIEFWPKEYEITFPWLRETFEVGIKSRTGNDILNDLVYNKSHFNIAIHYRNGDITPTPSSYFSAVIGHILSDLKSLTTLSIDITIFSQNCGSLLHKIYKISNSSSLNVNVLVHEELSALKTFMHFGQSNIFVASDSSLAWVNTWIAGNTSKPITIAAPPGRGFQTWTTGTIRAKINGSYNDNNVIFDEAKKWLESNIFD